MEHLSRPRDPDQQSRVEVPYFCRETFLPDATVFTYPASRGYDRENFISNLELTPATFRDFEAFLQEWLYFTFLNQILDIVGVKFDHQDFIRTKQDGRRLVTTAKLQAYIDKWVATSTTASPEANMDNRKAINECIREVQAQCERLDRASMSSSPIMLSILILGETVGWARLSIYHEEVYDLWPKCDIPSIYMDNRGWCPNKVAMLHKLYGNASLYYLSLIGQTDGSGRTHHHCTELACKTHNIDRETYLSAHVKPDCGCEFAGPDEEKIRECIDAGGFPIVSFQDDELQVFPAGHGDYLKYTAISHVWSDGMGNLHANELPICQLRQINERVTKLNGGTRPCLFWMDTLCVPWINDEENRRRKAIGRMRDTYENANRVLVVSTDFTTVSSTITPVEALLRVASSGWMRRLWTLQEGVLAQSLHFEFSDRALDFNALESAVKSQPDTPFNPVQADSLQCGHHFQNFRNMQQNQLEEIHNALQWRNTSWLDDEPLCLSILLDLDAEKIAGADGKDRMWTLLEMLPSIPTQLVFAPGSRITQPGFTWAPKSIMHKKGYTMALGISNPTATLGLSGLALSMPGFLLAPRDVPNKDICFIKSDETGEFLTVMNLGKHDDGVSWAQMGPWNIKKPAIMYQHELDTGLDDAYGALVSIKEEVDNALCATFVARVQLRRENVEILSDILHGAWDKELSKQDVTASIRFTKKFPISQKWVLR